MTDEAPRPEFEVEPRPLGIPESPLRYVESVVRGAGVEVVHGKVPIDEGHIAMHSTWEVGPDGVGVEIPKPEK